MPGTACAHHASIHLTVLLGLLVVATTAAAAAETTDHAVEFSGSGTWGSEERPANASWIVIDDVLHGFVVAQEGRTFHCLTPDGDANDTDIRCDGEKTDGNYAFGWMDAQGSWNGTFQATNHTMLLIASPPATPSPILGFIITFLAIVFLVAAAILLALFVQERRVSRYLVRRLYEETKGRMPADWPENLRQQWIARVFIRGKN